MARPRSEDRRNAILGAASRVVATEGLGASTSGIAREAGVSNGSLFVYFETKSVLLNELYVSLKTEMGAMAVDGLPDGSDPHDQVRHLWDQWMRWATSHPDKRRALAQLAVSDDITAESRQAARSGFGGIAELLDRCRQRGPVRDAPLGFLLEIMNAMADATVDAIQRHPDHAEEYSRIAFDALWRVLG
ncbi:TetR/AcrR family transcriptional regulator [Nakamurella sp. A5-74]|uniref:TetR/AcrR family transcriptional regulator n=1 Tax=Nakamurella sp. A5-74 TaxID=3158264 RepID=A0AAU8DKB3_9ACTN